jgi:hypothetical protein
MHTLGVACVAIGFVLFGSCVLYYVIDEMRTGVRFRAHRRILFPALILGWSLFGLGLVLIESAEVGLAKFFATPFGWVFVLVIVGGVVNFWFWSRRPGKKRDAGSVTREH